MRPYPPRPWQPPRRWADPLIVALLLIDLILVAGLPRFHPQRPRPEPVQAGFQARAQDLLQGALRGRDLGPLGRRLGERALLQAEGGSGWDRALQAVQAAEDGDLAAGERLAGAAPGDTGAAFRQAWTWAYRGLGGAPSQAQLDQVREALGGGYAARVLAARVQARSGADAAPGLARARDWATLRLLVLGAVGLAGLLLALAGVAFALYLSLAPRAPAALPGHGMSGRALAIVLLGWFLALLCAGPLVLALVRPLPFLRPFFLPLVYAFHALAGVGFLLRAEGIGPGALVRRMLPPGLGRALANGLGFFTVAVAAVLAVALFLGPLMPRGEPPQRELMDLLAQSHGFWPLAALFFTVAVLAPTFEELMFRGFLLPWLDRRMEPGWGARRSRRWAVAISALSFAAMHLQPLGLPTLATLGLVLGFAYLRTGSLATSIVVHGLWNGGVFLVLRALT